MGARERGSSVCVLVIAWRYSSYWYLLTYSVFDDDHLIT